MENTPWHDMTNKKLISMQVDMCAASERRESDRGLWENNRLIRRKNANENLKNGFGFLSKQIYVPRDIRLILIAIGLSDISLVNDIELCNQIMLWR